MKHIYTCLCLLTWAGTAFAQQRIPSIKDTVITDTSKPAGKQLPEVIINGSKGNKFLRPSSNTVAKIPLDRMENPQVYSSIPKELIQDQMIVTYSDILKNIPGVGLQLQNNSNAPGGTVSTRGFSGGAYLRNGMPGMTVGILDPVSIETLEAIKGPSGTLVGSSLASFGGLYNRVTKRPQENLQGYVGYTAGSFGLSRLTADINTPLNEDRSLLLRLTGAKHYEGSFQDAGYQSYTYLAPSLTYKASGRLTFHIEGEYISGRYNSFYRLFPDASSTTGVHSPGQLNLDFSRRFIGDDVYYNAATGNLYLQANYKLPGAWQSQTNFSYSGAGSDGPTTYMNLLPGNQRITRNTTLSEYNRSAMTDLQQNFSGDFRTGSLRHRLLMGLDYYHTEGRSGSATIVFDTLNTTNAGAAYTKLTRAALYTAFANIPFTKTSASQDTYSAYVQEVLTIIDGLDALAGARIDRLENKGTFNLSTRITTGKYGQTAFSPRFGLVYQPFKGRLSLFANYMNGFQNLAPSAPQPDGSVLNYKPQKANQAEGGIKLSLFGGRLASTVSYYTIKIENVVRADPNRAGYNIQDGTQESKGIEADLTCSPINGLNLIAGYAHNDSKLGKTAPSTEGLRPASAGAADMANGWISYRVGKGLLNGFGLGFGGNYAGKNIVSLSKTSSFVLPAYTVLNASVFYDQPKFRLGLKSNNLNNEQYYIGWVTVIPQAPRTFMAEFTLKFGGFETHKQPNPPGR
jgi:iron complex outermembrane receptor protein